MRIGNSKVMNYIDQFCTINLGIPGTILMENAALKVVKNVEEKYKNIVIVCGVGNNGGDGMACARHFKAMEKNIEVFCIGNMEKMSKDCKFNYDILINMGIKVQNITDDEYITKFEEKIKNADLILDCIFGTGLNREVKGIYNVVISIINKNANYIMSVDVPTGLNSDNGFVMGNAIKANKTISFVMQKKGFFNYKNEVYTGEVIIENIGVPEFVIEKFHEYMYIVDENMITNSILKRDKYAHKGDFGKVCIFAGSKGYSGAAYIATEAAVRCGSGLTTLCTANELQEVLSSKLVEAMTVNFEEKERVQKLISSCNAIGVGPGMGNSKETFEIVKEIISKASCPVVLDADAINVLKDKIGILKLKKNKIILTPHLGEMSRISGISVKKIEENRIDVAKKFAFDHNIILVLKGYNTIITDGKSVFINSTGSSYMASGGMGDCLTGIIVSLVGQGYAPIIAAVIGSFIHGYCGDNLSHKMENVTASDVLHEIPYAIKKLVIKKTNYEY